MQKSLTKIKHRLYNIYTNVVKFNAFVGMEGKIQMMRFKNLEAEIKRVGKSVEEVSNELGFAKAVIYNRLRGDTKWVLDDMLKFQEYLNLKSGQNFTLDYLFLFEIGEN